MKSVPASVLMGIALLLSGCQAKLLQHDQMQMRLTLLTLYEDQLWDNLIRTRNHQPLVQIDYSDMAGLATNKNVGIVGGTHEKDVNRRTMSGPLATAAQFTPSSVMKDVFNYTASGEQDIQIGIKGNPVTTSPEVYTAYIDFVAAGKFLSAPDDPTVVCTHGQKPLANAAFSRHIGDAYYFVPTAYERDFFSLFVNTTLQRTAGAPAIDLLQVQIFGTLPPMEVVSATPSIMYRYRVQLFETIKNSSGKAFVPTEDGIVACDVQPVGEDLAIPALGRKQLAIGEDTRTLYFIFTTGESDTASARRKAEGLSKALQKQPKIEMRLTGVRLQRGPSMMAPELNPFQPLYNEFERFRFNQELR